MKRSNSDEKTNEKESNSRQSAAAIVGYLQDFGLTEKEAVVFVVLSKMSSATASQIANATELNSLQTYRAMKGLVNYGLVEISLERPRRYTPLNIEQAIALLSQEAERKVLDLETKTPSLLKEWATLGGLDLDRKNFTFRIVQGSKNVSRFRLMLYQSAKSEIATIMKSNELAKMVLEGTDDIFEHLRFKNVTIRGLSEVNRYNVDASKKFLEFIKLHHVNRSNLVPFTIIDGQEVLICMSRDGKEGVSENAIWTNHPDFACILKEYFENLWSVSEDGSFRVREIEKIDSARPVSRNAHRL